MFEYLPQLSEDIVCETIVRHVSDRHRTLSREEGLQEVEHELEELRKVNESAARGVIAAIDSVLLSLEATGIFTGLYQSKEVKDFWKTISPPMRIMIIEGILALLRGIDQALWAQQMGKRMDK